MRIVGGLYKNRKLLVPKGLDVRPTTSHLREAIFNRCQSVIEGSHFLDLYAGSGAMGLEALSRLAEHVTFIDNSKKSVRCIEDNIKQLDEQAKTCVLYGDVLHHLKKLRRKFSIVFADPPYTLLEYQQLLETLDRSELLEDGAYIFIESERKKGDAPMENLETLEFIDRRRYGISQLDTFRKKDRQSL